VLDVGCGTGADAVWLAGRGVEVTAADASAAMLDVARRRVQRAGVDDRVHLVQVDLARPDATIPRVGGVTSGPAHDGLLADFGVLNCLPDRAAVAQRLAAALRPGASAVLVLMSPVCLWEIGWHLAHGRPGDAARRWRPGRHVKVGPGAAMPVWYPTPRTVRRELAPWFAHVETRGVAVAVPPPYLDGPARRHPGILRRLQGLDRRLARAPGAAWIADHYLILLERR
jgi:SAM-dependent methyltransferase